MDCSLPSSSVHGILQARILEWVAIPFSRGSSPPGYLTWVSCIAASFFIIWATREALRDINMLKHPGENHSGGELWLGHTLWGTHGCSVLTWDRGGSTVSHNPKDQGKACHYINDPFSERRPRQPELRSHKYWGALTRNQISQFLVLLVVLPDQWFSVGPLLEMVGVADLCQHHSGWGALQVLINGDLECPTPCRSHNNPQKNPPT